VPIREIRGPPHPSPSKTSPQPYTPLQSCTYHHAVPSHGADDRRVGQIILVAAGGNYIAGFAGGVGFEGVGQDDVTGAFEGDGVVERCGGAALRGSGIEYQVVE